VPGDVLEALMRQPWPGNVRELQNVVERAVIATKGPTLVLGPVADGLDAHVQTPHRTLAEVERDHILQTLRATNWVIGGWDGAATRLGLSRTTLIARMQRLGLTRDAAAHRRAGTSRHQNASADEARRPRAPRAVRPPAENAAGAAGPVVHFKFGH
jgi:formate hydrogenlyase transcriptional activator